MSLVGDRLTHFDTAARVATELVQRLEKDPLPSEFIFNVNVPDLPYEELAGIRVCRLGFRHKSEPVVKSRQTRMAARSTGSARPGDSQEKDEGTDFHALEHGAAAITPLKIDLTRTRPCRQVEEWLRRD